MLIKFDLSDINPKWIWPCFISNLLRINDHFAHVNIEKDWKGIEKEK